MRSTWLAALAAAVALVIPVTAQANEVSNWNRIAMSTLVVFPGPAGGAPPALQVHMAMVQGAVYDAINATEPKHHRPYLLNRRFGSTASQEAAAATAAYRVLSSIVAGVPLTIPFSNRASLLEGLTTQYNTSKAAIPESPFKRMGINAGNAAADAMIAARMNDGRFGPSQWGQQTGAGYWQPLIDPITFLPLLDPTPWVGGVRPFLHAELLAVPHRRAKCARKCCLCGGSHRGDANGSLTSAVRTLRRRITPCSGRAQAGRPSSGTTSPRISSKGARSTWPTALACSR